MAVVRGECQPLAPELTRHLIEDPTVPTYQYSCTECGHAFEQVQSFSDDTLTVCPECQGRLRKVFNAVGVVFKGSGFYRTDSRSGSSSTVPAASDSGSSSSSEKSSDSSSSSGSSSDKASAKSDSKPAAAASTSKD
nr:FmdB family zinc ribbon protein [Nocardioides luti]